MESYKHKKSDILSKHKTIMVYVYGHITSKTFEIWNRSLSHIPSDNLKVVSNISHNKTKHIDFLVVDSKDILINDEISKLIDKDTAIVKKEWIIDSLKLNILLPTSNYLIDRRTNDKSLSTCSEGNERHKSIESGSSTATISTDHGYDDSGDNFNSDGHTLGNTGNNNDTTSTTAYNQYIIDKLKNLENIYNSTHDDHRTRAYRRCCQILAKQPHITNIDQLEQLKSVSGIGKSMLAKIEEIVATGNLKKLDNFQSDPKLTAMQELSSIWGVGPVSAEKLYSLGIRRVTDLESKSPQELSHLLNEQQLIGLKRNHDISQRIPRNEVDQIVAAVTETAKKLCPDIICACCGSYRRGKPTCGDVDILLSPPDPVPSSSSTDQFTNYSNSVDYSNILSELIAELSKIGFLTDHLSMPGNHSRHGSVGTLKLGSSSSSSSSSSEKSPNRHKRHRHHDADDGSDNDGDGGSDDDDGGNSTGNGIIRKRSSYMGICKLPDSSSGTNITSSSSSQTSPSSSAHTLHRRIDIKTYSRACFPFALLYFTGSDIFNRSMRYYADKQKGYTLSDKGLRSCIRSTQNNREKVVKGKHIPCSSEREIFEVLGLEYKEPWEREGVVQPITSNS